MKKLLSKIGVATFLNILVFGIFFVVPATIPQKTEAQGSLLTNPYVSPAGWAVGKVFNSASDGLGDKVAGVVEAAVMKGITFMYDKVLAQIGKWYLYIVVYPLVWYISFCGFMLDTIIRITLNFGQLYQDPSIRMGWGVVRDVCNLFFIFILILASIKTIFQSKVNKALIINTILAAIAINFSLYITKAILDIGNIFAIWIYNAILGVSGTSMGLGSALGGTLGPQGFFYGTNVITDNFINDANALRAVIFYSIILFLTSLTITKAGYLFIGRTVAFVFHMILAPIGIMSLFKILPDDVISKYDWKKEVTKDALMPVYYFTLLFISIYFAQALKIAFLKEKSASSFIWPSLDGSSYGVGDFIVFLIIYKLFSQCYTIAKDHSGSITSGVAKVVNGAVEVGKQVGLALITAGGSAAFQGTALAGKLAVTAGGTGMKAMAARSALMAAKNARSTGTVMTKITGAVSKNFGTDLKKTPGIGKFVADATKSKADLTRGGLLNSIKQTSNENIKKYASDVVGVNASGEADTASKQRQLEYAEMLAQNNPSLRSLADSIKSSANKNFNIDAKKEIDQAVAEQMETKKINGTDTPAAKREREIAANQNSHKTESVENAQNNATEIKNRKENEAKIIEAQKSLTEEESKMTAAIKELTGTLQTVKNGGVGAGMDQAGFGQDPDNIVPDKEGKVQAGAIAMTPTQYKAMHAATKTRLESEQAAHISAIEEQIKTKEVEKAKLALRKETELKNIHLEIEALENNISRTELDSFIAFRKELEDKETRLEALGKEKEGEDGVIKKTRKELFEQIEADKKKEFGQKIQRARRREKMKDANGKDVDMTGMTDEEVEHRKSIEEARKQLREFELRRLNQGLKGTANSYANYGELSEKEAKAKKDAVDKNREIADKSRAEEYGKPKTDTPEPSGDKSATK